MPKRALPRISKTAGQEAIERIVQRRREVRDPELAALESRDPAEHPLAVIQHVLSCRRVPDWVTSNDVLDGLWVLAYIRLHCPHRPDEADRLEHELLELGRAMQIAMIRMAPPLNVRSRQAVEHRLLRHRASRLGLGRSERLERAHRLSRTQPENTSTEARWYDRHALALWEAAAQLVASRSQFDHLIDDEMAECLIGLRRAVREMQWPLSPAHYSTLREIGWWVQEIVDSLDEPRYAAFREQLGEIHATAVTLAAGHHRARFGDT
ncbi:hypothetical protein [Nonomuraea zeae]|uniref:Uncharacterized protein n=1 Tax=Nonomuraea zeae TaxID=1642303 RepID=A0A5S4G8Z7_9ACTN|nr:hypothetical protein [Nonomuraea zeae]TMR29486.1 hypothetical protein ETD85_32345 [Nonomuraea zeae]